MIWFGLVWFGLVLWQINHCRLFNAKFCSYILSAKNFTKNNVMFFFVSDLKIVCYRVLLMGQIVQPLQVRMDQGAMAMKRYSTFPKYPRLENCH